MQCRLGSLLGDYRADMEPLSDEAAELQQNAEIAKDFLALQENNLSIELSPAVLATEATGRAFPNFPEALPQCLCMDQQSGAPRDDSDSDLTEPEQSASRVSCQKKTREMQAVCGGKWVFPPKPLIAEG